MNTITVIRLALLSGNSAAYMSVLETAITSPRDLSHLVLTTSAIIGALAPDVGMSTDSLVDRLAPSTVVSAGGTDGQSTISRELVTHSVKGDREALVTLLNNLPTTEPSINPLLLLRAHSQVLRDLMLAVSTVAAMGEARTGGTKDE